MRLSVELGSDAVLGRSNGGRMMALSADGTRLALTLRGTDAKVRLATRLLHQSQATILTGTEGASYPFFSPDGKWIGFFAESKLKKVSVDAGSAVTLCDTTGGRGASWGDDGYIIAALANFGPLSRIPEGGGAPVAVTKLIPPERTHRWPQVLPGAEAALLTSSATGGNYDDANIDVVVLKTGERRTIHRGGFSPRYLASGHLVFVHESALFSARFDPIKLALTSSPVPILEDVSSLAPSGGDFAFSETGTFVYLAGRATLGGFPISWLDSSGKRQPLQSPSAPYSSPRFSPDGKRLAYSLLNGSGSDIWVKDLERDTPSKLTSFPETNGWPVWTPDGQYIIFRSDNTAAPGLYIVRADGSSEPQRLTEDRVGLTQTTRELPYSISSNGKRLAYHSAGSSNPDLFTAPLESGPSGNAGSFRLGKPEIFVGTQSIELQPAFSPDGRWLAYASNETGTFEIYVRPFPGPGGRSRISTSAGSYPVWSPNRRELFFMSMDRHIMVVDYSAKGDSFVPGKPRLWSEAILWYPAPAQMFDVALDGKRVAAVLLAADSGMEKPLTHVTFLLNFFDELRRKTAKEK